MILTKEKGQRMWGGGFGSGGGGGLDAAALAGYATQQFVEETYVAKSFFNTLFTVHGKQTVTVIDGTTSEETVTETDIVFAPNETPSTTSETDSETGDVTTTVRTITSIEANYGFWTDQFLSALGLNSSSGGGGGGVSYLSELLDVQLSSLTNGQALVYNATSQKWENQTIGGGSGGGTLSSIGLVMPTGFTVSPATLQADGSFTVTFTNGYRLLNSEDEEIIQLGYTAYQWGDHAQEGYATETWVSGQGYATQTWVNNQGYATQSWVNNKGYATQSWVNNKGYATQSWVSGQGYATETWVGNQGYATASSMTSGSYTKVTVNAQGIVTAGSNPTTLAGYGITDAVSSGTTWWGRSISGGAVAGSLTSVEDITMSGYIVMGNNRSIQMKDSNSVNKVVLTLNSSDLLSLGYGTRLADYDTRIEGNTVNFMTGDGTDAAVIDEDGMLWIKEAEAGIRIGDGLITWDSTNNAIKVAKYDGSAANFYSLGAVSALGFQSGGSADSATFSQSVTSPKFYFDSSKYLYVSGTSLMFYNGSTAKTVTLT